MQVYTVIYYHQINRNSGYIIKSFDNNPNRRWFRGYNKWSIGDHKLSCDSYFGY